MPDNKHRFPKRGGPKPPRKAPPPLKKPEEEPAAPPEPEPSEPPQPAKPSGKGKPPKPRPNHVQPPVKQPNPPADPKPSGKADPLDTNELNLDSLNGLFSRTQHLRFIPDATGFMFIIEATWEELSSIDHNFAKLVPLSVFTYYCFIAYWKRVYNIFNAQDLDEALISQQLEKACSCDLVLPKPIWVWLAGLGDIVDPNRREWQIMLETFPSEVVSQNGLSGYNGRVERENYGMGVNPISYEKDSLLKKR